MSTEATAPAAETSTHGETIATELPTVVPSEPPAPVEEPVEEVPADEAPAEDVEASADTTEEPAKPAAPEKLDWREKRRIEETNKRRAAEAENARLKAEIEALKGGKPASEETQQTTQTAEQIRAAAVEQAKRELAAEEAGKAFQEATTRVLEAGLGAYTDFEQARLDMVSNFGDQLNARPDFFDAIVSLENGHDVFYALAKDPEQAEQVLSLPPVKMAIKIAQLGATAKAATPEPKPISKAPAPIRPVGGATQASTRLDDADTPMDAWAQTYLKQMAGKGR